MVSASAGAGATSLSMTVTEEDNVGAILTRGGEVSSYPAVRRGHGARSARIPFEDEVVNPV